MPVWRAMLWGMEQGLTPDADLFELCIAALAMMPRRHKWAANILKFDMRVRLTWLTCSHSALELRMP